MGPALAQTALFCKNTFLNYSGKISSEELRKVLTVLGEMKLSLEDAEEMISMVDTDKDNMMDYMEFVTLFTKAV